MAGILKVDTIQNANASNIVTQANATTITVGAAGQTVSLDGGVIKSGSTTLTIGTSGQTVALASGATSSGFGATYNGAVNWSSTVQTTGFTAVSGNGYFCNTTSGAFTVTLPASPSAGSIVAIADYANTVATNNITVGRNGSSINGVAVNGTISVNGQVYTLVYVDSTQGWKTVSQTYNQITTATYVAATGGTITTCGNYKIHTFTSSGCFVVSNAGNPSGSTTVDYLVVAGGASGGSGIAGGGGAGGFRQSFPNPATAGLPVSVQSYPITVGAGGTAAPNANIRGNPGNNSIFSTITSAGGGAGSGYDSPATAGGSGGGGSGGGPAANGAAGNTPPVSPSQGNNGGNGSPGGSRGGGGGGGATSVGSNAPSNGAAGGNGTAISISGSSVTYAGGGGGGSDGTGGAGGTGGGGAGGPGGAPNGISGTTNTGGGSGGGGPGGAGGTGGSGIVIIRYKYQ